MACRPSGPPPPVLGEWALSGEQAQGFLRLGQGECQIGLWTPRLSTGGEDGVSCSLEQSEQGLSVVFPLRSGAGDATAAARWTDSGLELPLASRPGEVILQLSRQDPAPNEDQRLAWS